MSEDPLFRRIRQHAAQRLTFAPDSTPAKRLPELKEFMRLENEMLNRYHRKGDSGLRVAKARSIVLDVLLTQLFEFAVQQYEKKRGKMPCAVALVALGGYGREEVSPFSDVDLMFLYPKKVKPEVLTALQEDLVNEILYPMWDLNLKVGHSSRTLSETIQEARSDDQTKNALLEARFICGAEKLFSKFSKEYETYYRKTDFGKYGRARLDDQRQRREKHGNTVFLQEPDIKNGVGGLRDYQNILWMARIRLGVESLDELADGKNLSVNEVKGLQAAYNFLLRVRNELHFSSARPTDLLNLEKQPGIAWRLGYRQHDIFRRVEAFMKDYYSHANRIFQISRLLERRLARTGLPSSNERISFREAIQSRQGHRQKKLDGFTIFNGAIAHDSSDIFKDDPGRLIRLFRYVQQFDVEPELDLLHLVSQSLDLITREVIYDPNINKTFRSILQSPGQVYGALMQMHELGVLGRFMPEFGRLTCLVQHEYYHRYTADIHILSTIRELDSVFAGEGKFTKPYRSAIHDTTIPSLLYLILLLHDLGKADGIKNHDTAGGRIAVHILKRLGIPTELHSPILFIIENHLEMARFWQRFDVEDEQTILSLANLVGEPDTLRYLYVHTFCDARGTAHGLWNSYKQMLHDRLFQNALELLNNNDAVQARRKEQKDMTFNDLLARDIPGISREEIEAHFSLLPERYFLHNTADEIEQHIVMIHDLLTTISEAESIGSLVPVIHWHDDHDQGLTMVNVVTWDRAGLFYKLAGAFSVAGLNILSTKAISRSDHITIDTFYVVEPNGGIVQNKRARAVFEENVRDSLLHNKDLFPRISAIAKDMTKPSFLSSTDRLKAPIPASVDVYHELSLRRTIIEVQASDHIGLLYQLAKAIYRHGFDITFARISTERGAALDTFYIENINPNESAASSNLVALRETLNKIVLSEEFLAVG